MGSIPISGTNFSAGLKNENGPLGHSQNLCIMNNLSVPIILRDKYIALFFAASFVILVIAFALVYVKLADSGNLLIIHSDVFRGADYFGNFSDIMGIIAVAFVVWITNILLAQEFYFKERFISYLLVFSTSIFMILILIAVNAIISIN